MLSRESCFLIGLPRQRERELEAQLGGPAARFFTLAQRCAWGVSQPDLVRADIDATLRALAREYPATCASHLLAAFARRAAQPERAAEALARATQLAPPEHPFHYLLPSADEWRNDMPAQQLEEVVPGRVWRIPCYLPMASTALSICSVATLIRLERGGLALINPVALAPEVLARVRALGEVQIVASQGKGHSRFIDSSRALFPGARVLGTEGHRTHPASAHLAFDGILGSDSARLPDELLELPVRGTQLDEVLLLHRPSKLLVVQDFAANHARHGGGRPFAARVEAFAFGLHNRVGFMGYQLMLWQQLGLLQRCLRAIAAADFSHVTGAHWPLAPCGGLEREQFGQALAWAIGLSAAQHKLLLVEYFARQPGFLRDLLRYGARQKKLRAAGHAQPSAV